MTSLRHQDAVALVSGGARGQGRQIARRLASEGAHVAIFDVCRTLFTSQYPGPSVEDLAETERLVTDCGRECMAEVIDVRDRCGVGSFIDQVVAHFGQLDIVCANAGFVTWIPFLELNEEQWREVVDVNLTGVFNTLQPALRVMAQQLRGSVVVTASCNSREPGEAIGHYTAAKHGVIGLVRNLALEFGPYNVRVNAILPSVVNTPMTNNPVNLKWIFGRDDATEEEYFVATRQWHALRNQPALSDTYIAEVVSWLASEEARHITGVDMPVDAGHLMLPGFNHRPITE